MIPERGPVPVGAQFKPQPSVVPQPQDRVNDRMWVLPWHHEADMIIRYELRGQWQRRGDHRHTERRVLDDLGWQAVPEVRQIVQQTKAGQRPADSSQGAVATEKARPRQIACGSLRVPAPVWPRHPRPRRSLPAESHRQSAAGAP